MSKWLQIIALYSLSAIALGALWTFPLAGHHHLEVRGLLGWLLIDGEEPNPASVFYVRGYEYRPTWFGLPPTVAATGGLLWLATKAASRLKQQA